MLTFKPLNTSIKNTADADRVMKALIGELWALDRNNMLDDDFNSAENVQKNLNYLGDLFSAPSKYMNVALAFATTMRFVPCTTGYKFNLKNSHQLSTTETILYSSNESIKFFLPWHNLFLVLDGKAPVDITGNNLNNFSLDSVNSIFPYFKVSDTEAHYNHKQIEFTRPDLLKLLNEMLSGSSFNLGWEMYCFLMKGKDSICFPKKYFDKQLSKYFVNM